MQYELRGRVQEPGHAVVAGGYAAGHSSHRSVETENRRRLPLHPELRARRAFMFDYNLPDARLGVFDRASDNTTRLLLRDADSNVLWPAPQTALLARHGAREHPASRIANQDTYSPLPDRESKVECGGGWWDGD